MQANIATEQTNLENEFAALDTVEGDNQAISGILNGETTGTPLSSSGSSSSSSSSGSSSSSFGSVGSGSS
jgi:hypothetical protein